jgi:phosphatidylinositol alpha-1,6-mannosyltransferase
MMPKFTLITHDFPPAKGGVARYLSSLATAANGQIEVLIPKENEYIVHRTSYKQESADRFVRRTTYDVRNILFSWSFWPRWLPLIKRCLEVPQENIILTSHVFPIGTAAWIANALGGSEYAVIFHGTDLKRAQTRWKRWLLRRICINAELLIVNSQATEKMLKRLVPKANPLILTPGLEPFEVPDKLESRTRLGVPEHTKVILAVARLVERKGLDTLIQATANLEFRISNFASEASSAKYDICLPAVASAKEGNTKFESESSDAKYEIRYSKYELVIVGDGPYAEPLHKLAELSGVNVRWVSNADDALLHDWYSASDVFCLPGRETANDVEGFGMVFLEAAYAGLPVIAGQNGGTSEAVIDNQTGLLIPPTVEACTQALQKLLNDPNLALVLGTAGRERVLRDFNWSNRWQTLSSRVTHSTLDVRRGTLDVRHSTRLQRELASGQALDVRHSTLDASIVIPCYNHASELRDTLQSLVEQTVDIKQVIVVDDGSHDNPQAITQEFTNQLPLQFIRFEQNSGAPFARNRGAELANGEFIMFLDADIVLDPKAIEMMYQTLIHNPNSDYAYCDFIWGKRLFRGKVFNEQDLRERNYIHTSALIRRRINPVFDESLKKFQDWDLWLTVLQSGSRGIYVPETLFIVKERKTGISQWLPSFVYKIPWPILGYTPKSIIKYRTAEAIIKRKHGINSNR